VYAVLFDAKPVIHASDSQLINVRMAMARPLLSRAIDVEICGRIPTFPTVILIHITIPHRDDNDY